MLQRRDTADGRSRGGGGSDGGGVSSVSAAMEEGLLSADELECKICYCPYSLGGRRPKLLDCRHRLCAKCLGKILALGETALPGAAVVCPFCRYVTGLPGGAAAGGVGALPDDRGLVAVLALQSRNHRNLRYHHLHHQRHQGGATTTTTELLLSPGNLSSLVGRYATATAAGGSPASAPSLGVGPGATSTATTYSSIRGSPNFVVITIMEPPPSGLGAMQDSARQQQPQQQPHNPHHGAAYPPGLGLASIRSQRSSVTDSMTSITQRWTVWNCAALLCQTSARALVWALGLLYFSSLPMGVYLLIMQRTTLGVLLVSLVPASLVMVMVYGFCQCICHEFWDCMPP